MRLSSATGVTMHVIPPPPARRRLARAAITCAGLFVGAGAVFAAPAGALADSSHTLAIKSVGDMVVDGVHQRVFISDPIGGSVVATTYDGTVVASHAVNHPTNLALSPDSQHLYVA